MIKTFKSKALKALWLRGRAKGIDPKSADRIVTILDLLDKATTPEDLDLPGFDFHELKGNRKGEYAVEVRAQWRIVFAWEDGHAVRVNEEDYHGD
jgi:toxin HigB-1